MHGMRSQSSDNSVNEQNYPTTDQSTYNVTCNTDTRDATNCDMEDAFPVKQNDASIGGSGVRLAAREPYRPLHVPKVQDFRPHSHNLRTKTRFLIMASQELLVDVRSPSEFATGSLASDIAPTVNIEYQTIDQLPEIYATRGINVHKDDRITLYCRSGRRSNIALHTLKNMGYQHVRDIGGFEEARKVLDREQVQRQLDAELEKEMGGGAGEGEVKEDPKRHTRVKSFGALLDGLKALEE
jgi:rhodanese-related sulfurtransferase